jgi:hypothetical protein
VHASQWGDQHDQYKPEWGSEWGGEWEGEWGGKREGEWEGEWGGAVGGGGIAEGGEVVAGGREEGMRMVEEWTEPPPHLKEVELIDLMDANGIGTV